MDILIRKATVSDIPSIRGMADIVFRATYAKILSPEQMDYMMEWMYSADSLKEQICGVGKVFFIAESPDCNPLAYVSCEEEDVLEDGRALVHLQKIYVMPQAQGLGLGKILFTHVITYLRELHPEGFRVELNVNRANPAVHFYEKMGMHLDRQGDFPIGGGYYMNDYIYALDVNYD